MAEDAKRMDQYSYAATSNLVLQAHKSRPRDSDKGEVQSLWGKTAGVRMGDAVRSSGPDKDNKPGKKRKLDDNNAQEKTSDNDVSAMLLKELRDVLGHQLPYETMRAAHDEVLEICLDSDAAPSGMKASVEDVVGASLGSDAWHAIKRASDTMRGRYTLLRNRNVENKEDEGEGMNEDGVAVVFEDEEEDDEDKEYGETVLASDTESDSGDEGRVVASDDIGGATEAGAAVLKAGDVDEFYVQRLLKPVCPDPSTARTKAATALEILSNRGMQDREAENALAVLLGFDNFASVKTLMLSRWTIVYGVKLAKAEDKDKAESEIAETEEGRNFLDKRKDKDTVRELDRQNIDQRLEEGKAEAKKLKGLNAAGFDAAVKSTKSDANNLDLDLISFKDGARTMTNENVNLPSSSWRVQKAGYEEVHVPAVRNVPGEGERFIEIKEVRLSGPRRG